MQNVVSLPNVLSIGGQRCASTYLVNLLQSHPEVFFLSEVNSFFNVRCEADFEKLFELYKPAANVKVIGEKSPAYSAMYPWEIANIAALIPELKIIFSIRNPVERSISAVTRSWSYQHLAGTKVISRTDFGILKSLEFGIGERMSNYTNTYRNWTTFFGRHNVLVLSFDELSRDPQEWGNKISSFLKIDSTIKQPSFKERINVTRTEEKVSEFVKFYLAKRWRSMLDELSALLPEVTCIKTWQCELDEIITIGHKKRKWSSRYWAYRKCFATSQALFYRPISFARSRWRAHLFRAVIRNLN
ncbi:sulfotransferase family protein [Planctomycetaceae bacterium SH139]